MSVNESLRFRGHLLTVADVEVHSGDAFEDASPGFDHYVVEYKRYTKSGTLYGVRKSGLSTTLEMPERDFRSLVRRTKRVAPEP